MLRNIIPLSYHWMIRQALGNNKTILDVGCGHGYFMQQLNSDHKFEATGVDGFSEYVEIAKATGIYKEVSLQDIRSMVFPEKSFDAILLSQVIEHLTMQEADDVIRRIESIARNTVVIATPNGEFEQGEYHGNKLQEHHSAWSPEDFTKRGYSVHGQGANWIYNDKGPYHSQIGANPVLQKVLFAASYASAPVMYYYPQWAAQLIAVKKI